jgi:hypothetical protein
MLRRSPNGFLSGTPMELAAANLEESSAAARRNEFASRISQMMEDFVLVLGASSQASRTMHGRQAAIRILALGLCRFQKSPLSF